MKQRIRVPQCSTCGGGILGVVWKGQQCVGCAREDVELAEHPRSRAVVASQAGQYPEAMVARVRAALAKHAPKVEDVAPVFLEVLPSEASS